jgi:feruloyl esterase
MGGAGPDQISLQQAIEAWVEKDHAPDRLIASTRPSAPEQLARPLCPYPAIARYTRGPRDQASSFVCVKR